MIRILIADDHEVVRRGLTQLFMGVDDMEVVGEAGDGAQAADLAVAGKPDVVLMDLLMPGVSGVEGTRRIHAVQPDVAIVILTSFSEREQILDAVDAGAVGYLLKDAEPEELLRGIRAAVKGESPFSPQAVRALLSSESQPKAGDELTQREKEVLVELCAGLANKQIARRLGISEKTVKAHLTSIYSSIGVPDRIEAALWAMRNGIGPGERPPSWPAPAPEP